MFHLTIKSGNAKTGDMPVTTSTKDTCPNACPFKGKGCYAESGPLRIHWNKISEGLRGLEWKEFLKALKSLPANTMFRHNQAGDLVGVNDKINKNYLRQLVSAVKHLKGFTYTHYPLSVHNIEAIKFANANGFTVNVSTNNISEVDQSLELGLPTVTVLPYNHDTTVRTLKTQKGNTVLICPASIGKNITCKECTLCRKSNRSYAIGFIAHGTRKKII